MAVRDILILPDKRLRLVSKPVAKIDLPGVSGEITKEGVDIEVSKPKN